VTGSSHCCCSFYSVNLLLLLLLVLKQHTRSQIRPGTKQKRNLVCLTHDACDGQLLRHLARGQQRIHASTQRLNHSQVGTLQQWQGLLVSGIRIQGLRPRVSSKARNMRKDATNRAMQLQRQQLWKPVCGEAARQELCRPHMVDVVEHHGMWQSRRSSSWAKSLA
jgi:hypothetical protein